MLWVPITLMASALQVARNATQSGLVDRIGTLGATQVRFLFGLPFAVVFLLTAALLIEPVPALNRAALGWVTLGSLAQIGATALMLAAMRARGFAAATALIKTEPVMLALIGWVVLGDVLGPWQLAAIIVATLGTLVMTLQPGRRLALVPVMLALVSGFLFGLSAIGFRGAIIALPEGGFLIRATTMLVASLAIQIALLTLWLALFDRPALSGAFRLWRPSLAAGFLGAAGSQCWFMGFALTSAANVRTLALVEIVMARAISGRLFSERTAPREWFGMALIAAGVGALLMLTM